MQKPSHDSIAHAVFKCKADSTAQVNSVVDLETYSQLSSTCCFQVKGKAGARVNTIAGYNELMQRFSVLAADVQKLQATRRAGNRTLDGLLESAKVSQDLYRVRVIYHNLKR